jgi:hypothetical protein
MKPCISSAKNLNAPLKPGLKVVEVKDVREVLSTALGICLDKDQRQTQEKGLVIV